MPNRISTCALLALALCVGGGASARASQTGSIADLDARARASGNRLDVARDVGDRLFATTWPAQVLQVSANALEGHLVVGIVISGVKFHHPMRRDEFIAEVADVVRQVFVNAPEVEEVDVWTNVPISVAKGTIVSGDLAMPTTRVVFAASARRGETPERFAARVRVGRGAYWDEEWSRTAFKLGT